MSLHHTLAHTDASRSLPQRCTLPPDSNASSVATASLGVSGDASIFPAKMSYSAQSGFGGGGALTPTISTQSHCSTPTAFAAGADGEGQNIRDEQALRFPSAMDEGNAFSLPCGGTASGTNTAATAGFGFPLPSPSESAVVGDERSRTSPSPHARQWTPRRRSPCVAPHSHSNCQSRSGSTERTLTTVRDWVRSTRCSPSKEPRGASASRRDSFISSFASALVPRRDMEREENEEKRDGVERERGNGDGAETRVPAPAAAAAVPSVAAEESDTHLFVVPSPTPTTQSDAATREEGRVFAAAGSGAVPQSRPLSPQRTASWRQLRSHPGGASSRVPPPPPSSSSPAVEEQQQSGTSIPTITTITTSSSSSHPSWASPALAAEVEERDRLAATWMRGWGRTTSSAALSTVSSPSVRTPALSRCSSPPCDNPALLSSSLSLSPAPPPPLPVSVPSDGLLTAREREQMQVWRGQVQRPDRSSLPPPAPALGHGVNGFSARGWGEGGGMAMPSQPQSARSESLSRASAVSRSNTLWSQQQLGSSAQTSLGWQHNADVAQDAVDGNGSYGGGCVSAASSRCLSPVSLSLNCGGSFRRGSAAMGGGAAPCSPTSPSLSQLFMRETVGQEHGYPSTPLRGGHRGASGLDYHRIGNGGGGGEAESVYGGFANDDDALSMEDIEDGNSKRSCVESPTTTPLMRSLSLSFAAASSSPSSFSLAEVLAAQPTRMAVPSEVHLLEQRARRRRAVSPSLARPDDDMANSHDDKGGEEEEEGERERQRTQCSTLSESLSLCGVARGDGGGAWSPSNSPVTSAARTAVTANATSAAAAMAGQARHPASSSLFRPVRCHDGFAGREESMRGAGGCEAALSPSLAPLREATVAPSAAARMGSSVVELAEADGSDARADSLSFCSASEDEPEVDTFALERAQAVMEDADSEAVSELIARQHRLHTHCTSDFAVDQRMHGVHVDPNMWNAEEDNAPHPLASAHVSGASSAAFAAHRSSPSPPPPPPQLQSQSLTPLSMSECEGRSRWAAAPAPFRGGHGAFPDSPAGSSHGTPRSPLPTAPPASTHSTPSSGAPHTRDASAATATPSSPPTGRVSGEEAPVRTPPRAPRQRLQQHISWGGMELSSGEGRTPGSATTTASSHSMRDVSPPVRERSLAPAELRREAGLY